MNNHIEVIEIDSKILAYIISKQWNPKQTNFVTSPDQTFQLGMIVYKKGEKIIPHTHLPIERSVKGTPECIFVKDGKCYVDLYGSDQKLFKTRVLNRGDIILLLDGSHGFRMIEDTMLIEVKQGPYAGDNDKQRFNEQ